MPLNHMGLSCEVVDSVVLITDAATGDIIAIVTEADRRRVLIDRREVYLAKRNEETVTEAIRVAAAQA